MRVVGRTIIQFTEWISLRDMVMKEQLLFVRLDGELATVILYSMSVSDRFSRK